MKADDKYNVLAGLQKVGTMEDVDAILDPAALSAALVDEDGWADVIAKEVFGPSYTGSATQRKHIQNVFGNETSAVSYGTPENPLTHVTVRDKIFEGKNKEASAALMRYELGRSEAPRLRELLDMEVNLPLKEQMEALSKKARPADWNRVASIPSMRAEHQKLLTQGKMEGPAGLMADRIAAMETMKKELTNPDKLLADSWAMLNTPEGAKLAQEVPDLYKAMASNLAIKQKLGLSEALLDLKTGNMTSVTDRAPTIRDRGIVTMSGSKVTWNGGSTTIKKDFNILKATPDEASAHYYAAAKQAKSPKFGDFPKTMTTDWTNFHNISRVLARADAGKYEGALSIKIDGEINKSFVFDKSGSADTVKQLRDYYEGLKRKAITELRTNPDNSYSDSAIARLTDVDEEYAQLGGRGTGKPFWSEEYSPNEPTMAKLFYKNRKGAADGYETQALADSRLRIREAQAQATGSINGFLHTLDPKLAERLPDGITESGLNYAKDITRSDDAAGLLSSNQGREYGTGTSFAQAVGAANNQIKTAGNNKMLIELDAAEIAVKSNPLAVAEAAVLDSKLRQQFYTFSPTLPEGMGAAEMLQARITTAAPERAAKNIQKMLGNTSIGQSLQKILADNQTLWTVDMMEQLDNMVNTSRLTRQMMERLENMANDSVLKIENKELAQYWRANIRANSTIVEGKRTIAGLKGLQTNLRDDVLYPGALDPDRYKQIKFVFMEKGGVMADRRPAIIGAPDEATLLRREQLLKEKYGDAVTVRSVKDTKDFYNEVGDYDNALALNEWRTNSMLQRQGIMSDLMPDVTPQLFDSYRKGMQRQWSGVADNMTEMRYSEEFASLEAASRTHQLQVSNFKGEEVADNFKAQIATMLNKENKEQFQGWRDMQEGLDKTITKVYSTIKSSLTSAKSNTDYATINKYMEKYDVPMVYNEQVGKMLVETEGVPEAMLKDLIPKLNGAAATMMLRLDYIQPFINALSTPITAFPELKHLIDSAPKLAQQSNALTQMTTQLPSDALNAAAVAGGAKYSMTSNTKLMMQAVKDFWAKPELAKDYYAKGFTSSVVREMRDVTDKLALDPRVLKEKGISQYTGAFQKTVDILAKPADFSEEFTKFTAARMADLVLTKSGIPEGTVKNMAINSFIKRVHGNYTYAQRPALFQGIVGQAVGLFQTYQFNLFQQLLRHVGDKQVAAAAGMMGLQAGIFGAQSVPGFRAMSEYIGEKSQEGDDFYSLTQDAVGEEASEWILFGLASNFTKPVIGHGLELYTRGDLNPRTPFIIPTSIEEIPVYSLATKAVGSMLQAADAVSEGVPAGQVFAEALASNGVNRPLAGLGQILAGTRTTSKGSLLVNLQDMDWAQKAVRLLGTKTLDESVAVQTYYRTKAYQSYRQEKVNQIGRNVRTQFRSGEFDSGAYRSFMQGYAEQGGTVDGYDQWIHSQAVGATESQIYGMYNENMSPEGRYMQRVLGADIPDFLGVKYE